MKAVNFSKSFGMQMPGRNFSSASGYRFGFNGQEMDNEIAGKGNINTALYWEYVEFPSLSGQNKLAF